MKTLVDSKKIINIAKINGYATFEVDPSKDTEFYRKFFGKLAPSRKDSSITDILRPLEKDQAKKNSISSRYGKGRFPFHTDGAYLHTPPRYILLRSYNDDLSRRPTIVCRVKDPTNFESNSCIKKNLWIVTNGKSSFYSNLYSVSNKRTWFVRYDPCCMRLYNNNNETEDEILPEKLMLEEKKEIFWKKNKAVIIDNWKTLHARGLPLTYIGGDDRALERCFIMG